MSQLVLQSNLLEVVAFIYAHKKMKKLNKKIEGQTQEQIANKWCLHQSQVSKILNLRRRPTLSTLLKMSSDTGLTIDAICQELGIKK